MKINNILFSVVGLCLIGLIFLSGYLVYPQVHPCKQPTVDTLFIEDTTWHTIEDSLELNIDNLEEQVAYWKAHRDTIKLPGDSIPVPIDVDTAAILKDYFSIYKYGWAKENDTISVVDSVTITQNTPVKHKLDYKIKIPFTSVVNNYDYSTTYYRYLLFGATLPVYTYSDTQKINLADLTLDLNYVFPKGYVGVGWQPNQEAILAKAGVTLIKFKQKK